MTTDTLYKPLTWADLMADPTLRDLPCKVELEDGKIVMSPAGNRRANGKSPFTTS